MLATRNYTCSPYEKRLKSKNELSKYLNICMSLPLCMQLYRDSTILVENDNALDYFTHYNRKKYPQDNKGKDIEKDQKDFIGKNSDNKSVKKMPPKCMPQNGLFATQLSLFLKEVWFNKHEFFAVIPVSDIKYNYPRLQNNNTFYLFIN